VVHLKQLAKALRRYDVKVTVESEEDIHKATKWPNKLLKTDLALVDDSNDEYQSDYAPPPEPTADKPRKRTRDKGAALSAEYVGDSEDEIMFDAEPIPGASAKKNKKQKVAPGSAETVEESPSERKSTGGRGGGVNRKPSAKPKPRPTKKPTAAARRAASSKLAKQQEQQDQAEQEE
jgi:hypothetical protein